MAPEAGDASSEAEASPETGPIDSGRDADADVYVPECTEADDTCPEGQYCAQNECIAGCKGDEACGSGVCELSHDCEACVSDLECAGGRVCGTGVCSDACTAPDAGASSDGGTEGGSVGDDVCGAGFSCCSSRCVDTDRDIDHCGACDAACDDDQFCGASGCADVVFTNICDNITAYGLLDGREDDASTQEILTALSGGCIATTEAVDQTVAEQINYETGRPLTRGQVALVAAGGSFFQRVTGYAEEHRVAPLYTTEVAGPPLVYQVRRSADDAVVSSLPQNQFTSTRDIAIIELARDPDTGSLIVVMQGFYSPGTKAATWYFINVMLPSIETFDEQWYVFDWEDDGTNGASNVSEFTLKNE